MRLINADVLIEIGMFNEEEVEEMLRYAGIEAEPIVHGHWKQFDNGADGQNVAIQYECSECGCFTFEESNFCSNCGAKMDEEES